MKIVPLVVLCALIFAVPSVWANWVQDGVALCTATGDQQMYLGVITSDGAGGAIVTWWDNHSGSADIYAQRVGASGNVLWAIDGVALCTASGEQIYPTIISDGAGGAIVTWQDSRSGNYDIYAQRVNGSGAVQWTTDGVALCTAIGDQLNPTITPDGAGGAIVTWEDQTFGNNNDIYAQRVNASGTVQWTYNGVALCTATGYQGNPIIISDGAYGAIVTWYDRRSGNSDIYAQRVDSSGTVQWTTDGVPLCTAADNQFVGIGKIISDGAGGAIVMWEDGQVYAQRVNASGAVQWATDGVAIGTDQSGGMITSDGAGGAIIAFTSWTSEGDDIYAQRVNASGVVQWTDNGVAICTATKDQFGPLLTSDGAGGAIVTWDDYRSIGGAGIYAQRVDSSGTVQWATDGVPLSTDTGKQRGYIEYNSIGGITSDGAGGAIVAWNDRRDANWDIYAQRVDANGSVPQNGPGLPKTPQDLTARPIYTNNSVVGLLITWNRDIESNISHYEIYRDSTDNFVPGRDNLLASPSDTFFYDGQWRWFPHRYYKVAAVDSNGLRSGFALLRPDDVIGTDTPKTPEATYLAQNYPNPFNPTTRIEFGLRESARVSLRIYDVAGRLVRVVSEERLSPGRYARMWDGKDTRGVSVASGIYFYRLDAGTFTQTRKMVLLK
jgi:predicted lipoprotein with Yx(FWY)xxD motif